MLNKIRAMLASAGALLLATVLATGLGVVAAPVAAAAEQATASISGQITRADGSAPVDSYVNGYRWDPARGDGWSWAGSAYPDENGHFTLTGLVAGARYRLEVDPRDDDHALTYVSGTPNGDDSEALLVSAGDNPIGSVQLRLAAKVTGRITSNGSAGIHGASVRAYRQSANSDGWSEYRSTTADEDGAYTLGGLTPGEAYRIEYGHEDYAPVFLDDSQFVDAGEPVSFPVGTHAVETVTLRPGASISGRTVNEAGEGVQTYMDVYRWDAVEAAWRYASDHSFRSDSAGVFKVGGLIPGGRYRLNVQTYADDYLPAQVGGLDDGDGSEALEVAVGDKPIGTVTLQRAARITGKVTSDGTTGIPNLDIAVLSRQGERWYSYNETSTDDDGNFTLAGLTPGVEYRLRYRGTRQYAGTYSGGALSVAKATGVTVVAGNNPVPTVTLARGGTITGKVTGPDGLAVDAEVDAYAWDAADKTWELSTWTLTETGDYVLFGLRTDTNYRLEFWDDDDRYVHQYYLGASTIEDAQDVVATESGTALETVTLAEPPSIAGRVTSDGTTGIEGVRVSLYTREDDGRWYPRTSSSEADGRFQFTGLTPGATYRIGFAEAGEYAPTFYGGTTFADALYIPITQGVYQLAPVTLSVGATITGTVTADGTTGVAGVSVAAVGWDEAEGAWAHVSETESDESGRYTLLGLVPGASYKIRFYDLDGSLDRYFGGATTPDEAAEFVAPSELPPMTLDPDTRIATQLSLSASAVNVTVGQEVVLNAALALPATGNVVFKTDDRDLGAAPIVDGSARLAIKLAAGTWRIRAEYAGDDRYLGATAAVDVTVTPPAVTPPVVTPPVVTPPAPTAVTLSQPAWSKSSQTYGHKSVARVTTVVTGATSGTVTFRSGGKVLGTAAIVAGKASLALPAQQAVGAYVVTATVDATATTTAATSPASAKFTVVKAKLAKKSKVTGKTFKKNAKPKITVSVGKLNTGTYATGKVKIYVGTKVVSTVTVKAKNKGKITVTLPKKYAKAIKVKATYVGNATTASDTSKVATVKVR